MNTYCHTSLKCQHILPGILEKNLVLGQYDIPFPRAGKVTNHFIALLLLTLKAANFLRNPRNFTSGLANTLRYNPLSFYRTLSTNNRSVQCKAVKILTITFRLLQQGVDSLQLRNLPEKTALTHASKRPAIHVSQKT